MIISLWGGLHVMGRLSGGFCPVPIITLKKSFKYNEKRKGNKCTPCGTPTLLREKSEHSSPLKTRYFTLLYIFTIVLYILHV